MAERRLKGKERLFDGDACAGKSCVLEAGDTQASKFSATPVLPAHSIADTLLKGIELGLRAARYTCLPAGENAQKLWENSMAALVLFVAES